MAADETKRVTKTKQAQVEPRREIKRHLRRRKSGGALWRLHQQQSKPQNIFDSALFPL